MFFFFQQNMSDLIDICRPTDYLWHVERYKTFSKWPFKNNARCLPIAVSLNCTQIFYLNKAIPLQLVCCNLPYNTDVAKQLSKRTIRAIQPSPQKRSLLGSCKICSLFGIRLLYATFITPMSQQMFLEKQVPPLQLPHPQPTINLP